MENEVGTRPVTGPRRRTRRGTPRRWPRHTVPAVRRPRRVRAVRGGSRVGGACSSLSARGPISCLASSPVSTIPTHMNLVSVCERVRGDRIGRYRRVFDRLRGYESRTPGSDHGCLSEGDVVVRACERPPRAAAKPARARSSGDARLTRLGLWRCSPRERRRSRLRNRIARERRPTRSRGRIRVRPRRDTRASARYTK